MCAVVIDLGRAPLGLGAAVTSRSETCCGPPRKSGLLRIGLGPSRTCRKHCKHVRVCPTPRRVRVDSLLVGTFLLSARSVGWPSFALPVLPA